MVILSAETRQGKVKSRKLRRENYVPAVLYGKHLAESIALKLPLREAEQFLKSNDVGSRVRIKIGDETHHALLKELTREPTTGNLEHLSFMVLSATEKVKAIAHIVVVGREALMRKGVIIQPIDEINYRALPSKLIDTITVNVENMQVGDNIKVSDLEIANDPEIELLTPVDSVVVTINPIKEQTEPEEVEDKDEEKQAEEAEDTESENSES